MPAPRKSACPAALQRAPPTPLVPVLLPVLVLALALPRCACHPQPSPEAALRERLGVPASARTVLVFAQTSHLDIDWQKTFPDYYASWVEGILLSARGLLETQPRAAYGVAEMAFVQEHLRRHPEELAPLRAQVARRALRVVGGGMTSPDTLLPETEVLLRDYLAGARFAEDVLGARATAAWLPDSFGHSGTAPDVLAAAGFSAVAFGRLDGAPTIFESLVDPVRPPIPGSNAARLQALGSADFLWRGPGGGTVLAHWFASGLYCTGDGLDYDEPIAVPGGHLGPYKGDDSKFTDSKIAGYLAALQPTARTPYLFVPVGCDFQAPKPKLLDYLDGWNARNAARTGAFAVAATFEEYAALVLAHRDQLPVLESQDLTPYYMGFYGSRPGLKTRVREAARPFFAAELLAAALGDEGGALLAGARDAQEKLVRTDHHDFVTGTSADVVVLDEQLRLLDEVEAAGRDAEQQLVSALGARLPQPAPGAVARLLAINPAAVAQAGLAAASITLPSAIAAGPLAAQDAAGAVPLEVLSVAERGDGRSDLRLRLFLRDAAPLSILAVDLLPAAPATEAAVALALLDASGAPATGAQVARVELKSARVQAALARGDRGFALVSAVIDGAEAIARPSLVLRDFADQGGLWRLGHEMRGCSFTALPGPIAATSVEVLEQSGLAARVAFHAADAQLEASLSAGAGGLDLAATTAAAQGQTRTALFRLQPGAPFATSQPGGYLERTAESFWSPVFWPAVAWASAGEWALLLRRSTGVRFAAATGPAASELELFAARDARAEACDQEGGTGSDPDAHRTEWRLARAASPAAAEQAAQAFNRPLELWPLAAGGEAASPLPASLSLASAEGAGAISALKPADRGDGLVLRALLLPGPLTLHLAPALSARRLWLTDSSERDLRDLGPAGDARTLDRAVLGGSIVTLRLR